MSEPNPKYPGEWRPMPNSFRQPNRLTYAQAVFIEWFKSIHPKLHTHVYFEPDENGVDKPRVMLNISKKHDFGYDELYEIFKEDYEKINQQTKQPNGGYKKRGINTKRHRTRTRTRCKNRSSSRKSMTPRYKKYFN